MLTRSPHSAAQRMLAAFVCSAVSSRVRKCVRPGSGRCGPRQVMGVRANSRKKSTTGRAFCHDSPNPSVRSFAAGRIAGIRSPAPALAFSSSCRNNSAPTPSSIKWLHEKTKIAVPSRNSRRLNRAFGHETAPLPGIGELVIFSRSWCVSSKGSDPSGERSPAEPLWL